MHGEEQQEAIMVIKRRYHQSSEASRLGMVVEDDAPGGDEAEPNSVPVGLLSVGTSFTIFLCVQANLAETVPDTSPSGKLGIKEQLREEIRSASRTCEQRVSDTDVGEVFEKAIKQVLKGVRVHGWPLFRTPPSNALIPLMNSAFLLESKGFKKRDIELMAALSLISGRKFI
jgi:hypothetical protein